MMGIDKFGRHRNVAIDKFGRHVGDVGVVHHPQIFPLTHDGNYDAENKLIRNVALAREDDDCASKKYVDDSREGVLRELHTRIRGNVQLVSDLFNLRTDTDKLKTKTQDLHEGLTDVQQNFAHLKKEVNTELVDIRSINMTISKLRLALDNLENILKLTDARVATNKADIHKEILQLKRRVQDIEQK